MSATLPVVASPYSDLKAAWHMDKIAALRRGERIIPTQVQLILSDLCNQSCSFCAYRMDDGFSSANFVERDATGAVTNVNPNRRIPTFKAFEILNDCAAMGVRAIQFTGGGEPTVHPDHMRIFRHALDLGLECALVTNGVVARDGWAALLAQFAWVRVSLDAGSAATYASIRRTKPAHFLTALTHIRALADEIARRGSPTILGVGYVITPDNWHELAKAVAIIASTGAHNVRLSAMFSRDFDAPFRDIDAAIRDEIEMARTLSTPSFTVIDLYADRLADLAQAAPDYSMCGYQEFNVYVGGDLKVYRCCNTAYTDRGTVGDLSSMSFAEWWAASTAVVKDFDARSCDVCQFNRVNRNIAYLTSEEPPTHVNFV